MANVSRLTTLALLQCSNEYRLQILREFTTNLYVQRVFLSTAVLRFEYQATLVRLDEGGLCPAGPESYLRHTFEQKYPKCDQGQPRLERDGPHTAIYSNHVAIWLSPVTSLIDLSPAATSHDTGLDLPPDVIEEAGKIIFSSISFCALVWTNIITRSIAEYGERFTAISTGAVRGGTPSDYFWSRLREADQVSYIPIDVLALERINQRTCGFDGLFCHARFTTFKFALHRWPVGTIM